MDTTASSAPYSAGSQWHRATVVAWRDLTPTVRELTLIPVDGPVHGHGTGAHLQVRINANGGRRDKPLVRSYSLVGEPDGHSYRIAVKRLDQGRGGSLAMWQLDVGETLDIGRPQSFFPLDTSAPAYVLIAGGIGVTPLVMMAQRLGELRRRTGRPVQLWYVVRSDGEVAYRNELETALGEVVHIRVGRSSLDMDAIIATMPPGLQVYTCGPAPMLQDVQRAWQRAGRPEPDLRYETFGSSDRLAAQAFRVKLPRHGLDLTVEAGSSLLDALELAGVACLSDCRRGECGLCATTVLAVQGEIDHRDVFLSAHEKQRNDRMCICVSRVVGTVTLDSAYRPD